MSNIQMSFRISAMPRATGTPRYINRRHLAGQLRRRRLQFAAAPKANSGVDGRGPKNKMSRPFAAMMRIDCGPPTRVCNAICKNRKVCNSKTGGRHCPVQTSWTADLMGGRHDS